MADLKKVSLLLRLASKVAPLAAVATKNPEHHAEAETMIAALSDIATLVDEFSTPATPPSQ